MTYPNRYLLKPLLLVLCTGGVFSDALASPTEHLSTISVIGSREKAFTANAVQLGAFRDQTTLDTPSTVQVVTRELLDAQGATTLFDALKNTAGVNRAQIGGGVYDNLSIRGIGAENRANYRLNGALPVINLIEMPLENKARVEALKGVSALYYGFVSPSGIVNMVTNRAGSTPLTVVELRADQKGSQNVHGDLARRFGERQQFGARFNLSAGKVELGAPGYEGERRFASAALDWRATDALTFKLDLEHIQKDVPEPMAIVIPTAINGQMTLPSPPNPDLAYTNPDWQHTDASASHVLLRSDLRINDRWAATLEAGRAETKRERVSSQFQKYDLATGEGEMQSFLQHGQAYSNDNLRLELAGLIDTGPISHELTLGYTTNKRYQAGPIGSSMTMRQNLYTPRAVDWHSVTAPTMFNPSTIKDKGGYLLDRLHLPGDLQILAGLRYSDYENRATNGATGNVTAYSTNDVSPSLGLIWAVQPKLSLYTSYIEGLEEGGTAPGSAANAGEVLKPALSEQIEFGIKGVFADWQFAAAVFNIIRAQAYLNMQNVYALDGKARYRGLEVSMAGQILPRTAVYATAMLLNAEQRQAADVNQIGKRPENTPQKAASLFFEHKPAMVAGLAINAGIYYTGNRSVNALNQAFIPGVILFNAGASYRTKMIGRDTTFRLNIENLTNKRYWAATGKGTLGVGDSRLVKLAMKTLF
ncbi:TonB-dependent siderophore receptor [Chitinimonas sp. BJB300]|uniref:TonB-dependent siderophore receptor n=1 Tax=Chitinimonas sp. BJB300 TaxID=1559339 RepID=UPI000C10199E|nr:TonB-dependent siderophore receptor [Chitinimonas sp. BJB300]PHV10332.1 TonB-dependent siderophore receptor [Chitinimonas sp. BJB300]TSJ85544.1 TonB-dependent siderophore receptor [Chitinimonas sp. BJB300]